MVKEGVGGIFDVGQSSKEGEREGNRKDRRN